MLFLARRFIQQIELLAIVGSVRMHHETRTFDLLAILQIGISIGRIVISMQGSVLDLTGLGILDVAVEACVRVFLLHGRAHPEVDDVQRIRQGHQARTHRLVFDKEAGRTLRRGPGREIDVRDRMTGLFPFAQALVVGISHVGLHVGGLVVLELDLLDLQVAGRKSKRGKDRRKQNHYLFHIHLRV